MTQVFEDRYYQTEAVQSIYTYFSQKKGDPVLAMPTGTGKAVVIARFLQSVYKQWPNQRVLIATHVKELIEQNYKKLIAYWPFAPCGIYSAGLNARDHMSPIVFCGIQSVANKASLFGKVDIVIIDEAHLVGPGDSTNYQKFLRGLRAINPKMKVIGLTATPYRLGYGHIAEPDKDGNSLFTDVCYDITGLEAFNRLIAEGYLSPLVARDPKNLLNYDNVKIERGEFKQGDLQVAVDRKEVTYAALREALELAADRRHWLIFASGVEHSDHIAEMMEYLGQSCLSIHSKLPGNERDKRIAAFQRGEVRAIVNNNILTTGFDSPWIDCIVCLRPTASAVLWVQMLGRGTRPFKGNEIDPIPKENCLALDFANNTRRLGPINDPVVPRRKGEGGGEAPVKKCEVCDTWNHASVRFCHSCGAEFTFAVKIKETSDNTDLIKGDLPKIQIFKVDHITAKEHVKLSTGVSMMKLSYYCGRRVFEEYVGFDHPHEFVRHKAREWWAARTDEYPLPTDTAGALALLPSLPPATHLRVWTNRQAGPEIMATCFDGSAFSGEESDERPEISIDAPSPKISLPGVPNGNPDKLKHLDEDIPF